MKKCRNNLKSAGSRKCHEKCVLFAPQWFLIFEQRLYPNIIEVQTFRCSGMHLK
jgi:hypothetical protein